MIAVVDKACPLKLKAEIVRFVEREGFRVQVSETGDESLVSVIGPGADALADRLRAMPGVRDLRPVAPPYPLVSREHRPDSTRVKVEDVAIGGEEIVVVAGPCAVESREQILSVARCVGDHGASLLRGGAFKPRSSPYSFQGLGEKGLELLAEARSVSGLGIVTEVVAPEDVPLVIR
jgi:3-deoxy-7-phosphoheptulonate synthase